MRKRKHKPSIKSSLEGKIWDDNAISINWLDKKNLQMLDTKFNNEESTDEVIATCLDKVANKCLKNKMSEKLLFLKEIG